MAMDNRLGSLTKAYGKSMKSTRRRPLVPSNFQELSNTEATLSISKREQRTFICIAIYSFLKLYAKILWNKYPYSHSERLMKSL
jgi:hypothetical protein